MEDWIQTRPSILLKDRDSVDLQDLLKHGSFSPIAIPSSTLSKPGFALPPAWHLILFPPRNLESEISRDGYDVGPMSPPSPYFVWSSKETVRVGDVVDQTATVEKKREIRVLKGMRGERCHVFTTASSPSKLHDGSRLINLALISQTNRMFFLEPHPTFDAELRPPIPSMVTLFRYSALTFNAHKIHLDHDFATKVEGQPGPLVHADLAARVIALASSPLTDLKLDTMHWKRLTRFSCWRTEVVVRAKVIGDGEVDVWAVDGSTGNVVMVGRAEAE
ncbi:hypothetical protein BC829DRAFT_402339 [Chytridium lagenaria]|nr:hypothetical protein BC829DRAFT_402339 [Chytridium lagenaria]